MKLKRPEPESGPKERFFLQLMDDETYDAAAADDTATADDAASADDAATADDTAATDDTAAAAANGMSSCGGAIWATGKCRFNVATAADNGAQRSASTSDRFRLKIPKFVRFRLK